MTGKIWGMFGFLDTLQLRNGCFAYAELLLLKSLCIFYSSTLVEIEDEECSEYVGFLFFNFHPPSSLPLSSVVVWKLLWYLCVLTQCTQWSVGIAGTFSHWLGRCCGLHICMHQWPHKHWMLSEWLYVSTETYRCALAGRKSTEWIREPESARLQSKLLKVKTIALCKPNPRNVLPTSVIFYQAHSRAVVVFTGWRW